MVLDGLLAVTSQPHGSETYGDLLRSRPHWLFELTLELVSAPLVFGVGWLWRNGLLRHLHRDIHALAHHVPPECSEPTPGRRLALLPRASLLTMAHQDTAPTGSSGTSAPVTRSRPARSAAGTEPAQSQIATRHDLEVLAAQIEALRSQLDATTVHAGNEGRKIPRAGHSTPPT